MAVVNITSQTSDGSSSFYQMSGVTAVVQVERDSTMSGQTEVFVEGCSTNSTTKCTPLDFTGKLTSPGVILVTAIAGFYIRVTQKNTKSGDSVNISITY